MFNSSENQVRRLRSESGLLSVPYLPSLDCVKERTQTSWLKKLSLALKLVKLLLTYFFLTFFFKTQGLNCIFSRWKQVQIKTTFGLSRLIYILWVHVKDIDARGHTEVTIIKYNWSELFCQNTCEWRKFFPFVLKTFPFPEHFCEKIFLKLKWFHLENGNLYLFSFLVSLHFTG